MYILMQSRHIPKSNINEGYPSLVFDLGICFVISLKSLVSYEFVE